MNNVNNINNHIDLGKYIGKCATDYFCRYYSKDYDDYHNDIYTENSNVEILENGEVIETINYCVELTEVGVAPLIIKWNEVYYYKDYASFEYVDYYKRNYNIN